MDTKITAVVIVKNEEKNIKDCLESLKWCNEIILIDDNSTDKTIETARKYNVKIYKKTLEDFSTQRNFALSKATGEWVLFIDADERVSDALTFEISNVIYHSDGIENSYIGFYLRRCDVLWGEKMRFGESGSKKLLRLAKKNSGKWEGIVHEEWKVQGRRGELKNPLIHYPHQTLYEFLKEINWYTSLRAKELLEKKENIYWWKILVYPLAKFLLNYVYKKGFLDGERGLILAILMSMHSFLVRGKLWVLKSSRK